MKKCKWITWTLLTLAAFILVNMLLHPISLISGGFHPGHFIVATIGSVLAPLAFLVVGWLIWKGSRRKSISKWIGLGIIVWSVILLLPKALFLLAAVGIVFLICKSTRKKPVAKATSSFEASHAEYLDRWEQKK